jgi:regulator of replication initiation timing
MKENVETLKKDLEYITKLFYEQQAQNTKLRLENEQLKQQLEWREWNQYFDEKCALLKKN